MRSDGGAETLRSQMGATERTVNALEKLLHTNSDPAMKQPTAK